MIPILMIGAAYLIGKTMEGESYSNGGKLPLLAPNGKPSKLTPEQYKLVRTPEFKAWFGDWENDAENSSKVVDEETKEPLVVWHYARRLQHSIDRFYIFRTTRQLGSHFGSVNQIANLSSNAKNSIGKNDFDFKFYEVFLNIKNPIRMIDTPYWDNQYLISSLDNIYNIYEDKDWINEERNAKYFAKKNNVDGIVYLNRYEIDNTLTDSQQENFTDNEFINFVPNAEDSWIAFYPEQIKLADGSNTTFDGSSPDIRYDEGGKILESEIKKKLLFVEEKLKGNKLTPSQILYLASLLNFTTKGMDNRNVLIDIKRNKLREKLQGFVGKTKKGYAGYLDEGEAYHFTSVGNIIDIVDDNYFNNELSITTNFLLGEKGTSTIKDFNGGMGDNAIRFSDLPIKIVLDMDKLKQHATLKRGNFKGGTYFGEYELIASDFKKPSTYYIKSIEIDKNELDKILSQKIYIYSPKAKPVETTFEKRLNQLNIPIIERERINVKEYLFGSNTDIRYDEGGIVVGKNDGNNKFPKKMEAFELIQDSIESQGSYFIDKDGGGMFENKKQALKYVNEIYNFFDYFYSMAMIPVYRGVKADKVDLDTYSIGESWSLYLDNAKRFASHLGSPKELKIISAYVPKNNVDWESAFKLYPLFSDFGDSDAEFELPIPSNNKLINVKVSNYNDAKELEAFKFKKGGRTIAQTPAPKADKIYGSKVNPKGSASSEKSASKIVLSKKIMDGLSNKLSEFKKENKNDNITLNDLKAVYRRGLGAYSNSHRPNIPRNAWAMARVNKFLLKASGTKVKAAYVQDDDLMTN